MKIALVVDDLIQKGGQEQLFLTLCEMYPSATIHVPYITSYWRNHLALRNRRIVLSFMQRVPFVKRLYRFYGLLGLFFLAFQSYKFDGYAIVISVSARYAHLVTTPPSTLHVAYMNSPGRMYWEPSLYFGKSKLLVTLLQPFLSLFRLFDYLYSQRVDIFVANAKTPQRRIKKYYRRDSKIIYPFYSWNVLSSEVAPHQSDSPYFLVISRLVPWKRIDLVVRACTELNLKLKIIGSGSDMARLKRLNTSAMVEFLGYVSETEKMAYIKGCEALIFPQYEDFGITAIEAMSLGRPVIAFAKGGALETVNDGVTGLFFYNQTQADLTKVLRHFRSNFNYTAENCIKQANLFEKTRFIKEFTVWLNDVYLAHLRET